MISHSAGSPLALAVIENIKVKIRKVVLIAAYWRKIPPPGANKALSENYNWEKIKSHVGEVVIVNSDNDPWGCDDKQGKEIFEKLGGVLITKHGEGHMGSEKFNQPYKKFPLLIKLVEDQLWG